MRTFHVSMSRAAVAGLVVVGRARRAPAAAGSARATTCMHRAPESRPLEVPPDLDLPRTDGAMDAPAGR